jgi:hypothetical protein
VIPSAVSKNGVPIRLTDERWAHIIEEHGELAEMQREVLEAIAQPHRILEGGDGEFLAVRQQESERFLIVVYRELGQDGFIITAFLTSKINALSRRRQIWP